MLAGWGCGAVRRVLSLKVIRKASPPLHKAAHGQRPEGLMETDDVGIREVGVRPAVLRKQQMQRF